MDRHVYLDDADLAALRAMEAFDVVQGTPLENPKRKV
jgi:hypothetical protein